MWESLIWSVKGWRTKRLSAPSNRKFLLPDHPQIGITAFSYLYVYMLSQFSYVQLFVTLWTVAHQAPLSLVFSRQEYWGGLPCPLPGDLPDSGIERAFFTSPALTGRIFTTRSTWEVFYTWTSFSYLYTWTETLALPEFQACWPLGWNYTIRSPDMQASRVRLWNYHELLVSSLLTHPADLRICLYFSFCTELYYK